MNLQFKNRDKVRDESGYVIAVTAAVCLVNDFKIAKQFFPTWVFKGLPLGEGEAKNDH
jgi:hypothetical protein